MRRGRPAIAAALAAGDLTVLVLLCPEPSLMTQVRSPHAWLGRVGTDAALGTLAGAGLWVAAVWLGLGLSAAAAARLPGIGGRCAAAVCRALLPRALRGLLAGSAGLGIFLAPVAALAQAPSPASAVPTTQAGTAAAAALPSPAWPVDPEGTPAPVWPSAPPAAGRPPAASSPGGSAAPATRSADTVTVRRGDSLWLIAARRLGPDATATQIAAEWPRWYRANHDVIGADPTLIHPGEVLQSPGPAGNTEEARP